MARVNQDKAKRRARRRTPVPGRDPMPKSRAAIINALFAWYDDAVTSIDTRFFDVRTVLWMHKGPSPVFGGGMKFIQLRGLWLETATYESMRGNPKELKRLAFGSVL